METIQSITPEGKDVRVTFSPCQHSYIWSPLPGYTAEEYTSLVKHLIGEERECPTCYALVSSRKKHQ